jgi:hypothetical protein
MVPTVSRTTASTPTSLDTTISTLSDAFVAEL